MRQITEEIEVEAVIENLEQITEFVQDKVLQMGCPPKTAFQIVLALEEVFVNVANYAYAPETGMCRLRVEASQFENEQGNAVIVLQDSGKEFNPLLKEDPDITLSAEEREIGGLGIYMVKEIMNSVVYEYKDGQNCLTMVKSW